MTTVFKMQGRCLPTTTVINSPVTALPFQEQATTIIDWASKRESRYVCVANVHMLVEAHKRIEFARILENADMVTPDGMPLVWMMRLLGVKDQDRVAGMDLFLALSELASQRKVSMFFLGSDEKTLDRIRKRLESEFPNLEIAGMEPLPFRPLTQAEDEAVIEKINSSGAGLVFLALGCPKQEFWMAQHQGKINAVMLGVGWVFTVLAGYEKNAPRWLQNLGLEWLYRLIQDPGRLWHRYWGSNRTFIWLALRQLLKQKKRKLV